MTVFQKRNTLRRWALARLCLSSIATRCKYRYLRLWARLDPCFFYFVCSVFTCLCPSDNIYMKYAFLHVRVYTRMCMDMCVHVYVCTHTWSPHMHISACVRVLHNKYICVNIICTHTPHTQAPNTCTHTHTQTHRSQTHHSLTHSLTKAPRTHMHKLTH